MTIKIFYSILFYSEYYCNGIIHVNDMIICMFDFLHNSSSVAAVTMIVEPFSEKTKRDFASEHSLSRRVGHLNTCQVTVLLIAINMKGHLCLKS